MQSDDQIAKYDREKETVQSNLLARSTLIKLAIDLCDL